MISIFYVSPIFILFSLSSFHFGPFPFSFSFCVHHHGHLSLVLNKCLAAEPSCAHHHREPVRPSFPLCRPFTDSSSTSPLFFSFVQIRPTPRFFSSPSSRFSHLQRRERLGACVFSFPLFTPRYPFIMVLLSKFPKIIFSHFSFHSSLNPRNRPNPTHLYLGRFGLPTQKNKN